MRCLHCMPASLLMSAQRNGDYPFSANDDVFEPHCRLGTLFQRNGDYPFSADDDVFESYCRLGSRSTRQRVEKNKIAMGVKQDNNLYFPHGIDYPLTPNTMAIIFSTLHLNLKGYKTCIGYTTSTGRECGTSLLLPINLLSINVESNLYLPVPVLTQTFLWLKDFVKFKYAIPPLRTIFMGRVYRVWYI